MQLPFFVTPLYAALCGILLLMLSLRVIRYRGRHRVSLGDGGHDDLRQAIRAQGNLAEYAPLALFLLFLLEVAQQAPIWALHLLGAALFLGRVAHAYGILASRPMQKPNPGRPVGMVLTFGVLLIASVWLLIVALQRLS